MTLEEEIRELINKTTGTGTTNSPVRTVDTSTLGVKSGSGK